MRLTYAVVAKSAANRANRAGVIIRTSRRRQSYTACRKNLKKDLHTATRGIVDGGKNGGELLQDAVCRTLAIEMLDGKWPAR